VRSAIDRYLDAVLAAADLARRDAAPVREELGGHILHMTDGARSRELTDEEVYTMLENELGEPEALGTSIGAAKGRFRTTLKKQARRAPIALATALVLMFGIRAYAAGVFLVAGTSMEPALPAGAHVLVEKWSDPSVGDIVVYRDATDTNIVASVNAVTPKRITLSKVNESAAGEWPRTLDTADVVGRVWFIRR
jgi:hypothetical protein